MHNDAIHPDISRIWPHRHRCIAKAVNNLVLRSRIVAANGSFCKNDLRHAGV